MHDRIGRRDRDRRWQEAGGQHVDVRPDEEERAAEPRPELEQQNAADREQPAYERRDERSKQQAGAECGNERADLAGREPLLSADDDHREQQAGTHEVREPEEKRTCAQERLAPDEMEAFRKPRAHRCEITLAVLLERRPHRQQRESRERIRDRVDEERERTGQPEERAAERRSAQPYDGPSARLRCRGRR